MGLQGRPSDVELVGVHKAFGTVRALTDVNLVIERGESVAILGPNGAGKTTAISLMLGMRSPTAGSVRLAGMPPGSRAARSLRGAMLQDSGVPGTLSVRELVDLFRSYYPSPMATQEALGLAGLTAEASKKAGTLSGGQRQRLYFALAVCGDPPVLFLDEPTVGMDVASRMAFLGTIAGYAAAGKTVVLTTHFMEEADQVSRRIVVIDRGRIIADATPVEIKSRAAGRRISFRTADAIDADVFRGMPLAGPDRGERGGPLPRERAGADPRRAVPPGDRDPGPRGLRRRSRGRIPRPHRRGRARGDRRMSISVARSRDAADDRLAPLGRMLLRQSAAQARMFFRTPAVSVISFAMPVMLFLFFGLPALGTPYLPGLDLGTFMLASFAAYAVSSVMVFNYGVTIALDRGQGVDVLMRASPLPGSIYLLARTITAMALGMVGLVFLLIVAVLAGVHLPPQTWVDMAVRLMLGSIPFIALGFALAYLCSPSAAPAVANLLFIVLAFGSGMLIRIDQMPDVPGHDQSLPADLPLRAARVGVHWRILRGPDRLDRLARRLRRRVLRRCRLGLPPRNGPQVRIEAASGDSCCRRTSWAVRAFAAVGGAHFLACTWLQRTRIYAVLAAVVAIAPYLLLLLGLSSETVYHATGFVIGSALLVAAIGVLATVPGPGRRRPDLAPRPQPR